MDMYEISEKLKAQFSGLIVVNAWGEKSFFYNPDGLLKHGVYFCTLKEKDGANDKASNLNREGLFRLNFGISKSSFLKLFAVLSKRPAQGQVINGAYDFTALDILTPHPVYGWMAWVSIVNPTEHSWGVLQELLFESYELVLKKYKVKKLSQEMLS